MKRQIILMTLIAALSSVAFPVMRANPVEVVPSGDFRMSLEASRDARAIKYDIGDNLYFVSNRLIIKPAIAVSSTPLIEAYLLAGMSDLNRKKTSYYLADYDGSYELAGGLGAKVDLTGVDLDYYGNYNVNFYADVRYFKTRSRGEVRVNDPRTNITDTYFQRDTYSWNEYSLAFYASLKMLAQESVVPYLGVEWFYLDATYRYSKYKHVVVGQQEPDERVDLVDESGRTFFNDPQQWPKVVLGTDLILKSGVVLSFEAIVWGKNQTSLSIGASHTSNRNKERR